MFSSAFNSVYESIPSVETLALVGNVIYQEVGEIVSASSHLISTKAFKKSVLFTNSEILNCVDILTKVIDDEKEDPRTYVRELYALIQGTTVTIESIIQSNEIECKNKSVDEISEIVKTMIEAKRAELASQGLVNNRSIEPVTLGTTLEEFELKEIGDSTFIMVDSPDSEIKPVTLLSSSIICLDDHF